LTAIKDVAEASGGRPSAARQTNDPEVRAWDKGGVKVDRQ